MIWWPDSVPTLVSGTTTLRPMRPTDADDIYRCAQDPEVPRFTTLPDQYPMDLAISFARERNVISFENKTEIVFVVEDSRLVGRPVTELIDAQFAKLFTKLDTEGASSASSVPSTSSTSSTSYTSSTSSTSTTSTASTASTAQVKYQISDERLAEINKYASDNKDIVSSGFAGVISLHSINIPNHRAEIGYWFATEARNQGIGTKAAEMITEYGLMTMGFRRIEGLADATNEGSKKLLLNAGYQLEGILKQYVTRRDGRQIDMALLAATPK